MSYPVMPLGFLGSQGGDNDQYQISRSLRFNSADSAYLDRTFSTGNRKTWTWSGWVKRGKLGTTQSIFARYTANTGAGLLTFIFWNDDTLRLVSGSTDYRITTARFRDASAWYHLVVAVDTTQATAANRIKIYVNGSEVTSFSTSNNYNQNDDTQINENVAHFIGYYHASVEFDGYLAEIHFIDGQALTPSSFGETDAITGRWKAKAYTGSYGTNGFYLNFSDNSNTTSATLGKDSAGSNDWTPNNFSVTAGAGNDSLTDSPTNWGLPSTNGGGEVRGNYCTLNPLNNPGSSTLTNGNLDVVTALSNLGRVVGTFGMSSGKWYWEVVGTSISANDANIGIAASSIVSSEIVGDGNSYAYITSSGNKRGNSSSSAYGASYTNNDVIGIALDLDAGTLTFYKNNVSQGVAFSGISGTFVPAISDGSSSGTSTFVCNFGQRPFAYAAPSGFKALCTTNLPTPVIKKPSTAMDVVTYTGDGSARSLTGLGFSPDLVWIKGRSGATDHALYDSVRGVQLDLGSNLTTDETTEAQGVTAFNSDGFSIGTLAKLNTNAATYVSWAWDESAISGLDIVAYTGNGTARTIAHNLGVAPKMIIVKARTTASTDQGWPVYHASNTAAPETDYLLLNSTAATADLDTVWNDTAPTSSVFSVGTGALTNTNNDTYIAYCFAEVEGYSKFGSYTGNGSADGPFVYCGFRPRYILIKCSGTAATNWIVHDTARNDINLSGKRLMPNVSDAEASDNGIDIVSNGFKMRSADGSTNTNASNHIFAAFAESPFKYARAR